MTITTHPVTMLKTDALRAAPWNANKVSRNVLAKIRQSIKLFNIVENTVVRPSWCCGARNVGDLELRRAQHITSLGPEEYEVLSGNHRLGVYRDEGVPTVPCVVVELPDAQAKMLAQALNRVRGKDDPDKLNELLKDVLKDVQPADVSALLPHSEDALRKLLTGEADEEVPAPPEGPPNSVLGTVYKLGPHRLLCGDACDPEQVSALIGVAQPRLLATDPPYGVNLAQGWRDEAVGDRVARGTAQDDRIEGDEGFDWTAALALVPSSVLAAYLWHAGAHAREAEDGLIAHGFEMKQQIIWLKEHFALGRQHYQWDHEPCWYAWRKGVDVPWLGGNAQRTVWKAPSPKQIMGTKGEGETKEDHPTQKPIVLFEKPIVNHLHVGEGVYDPFGGSGTCLIAAARTDRVCYTAEIKPGYADVIRRRWTKWAKANGRDPGEGALE
jgi:DNA modification methylase